MHVAILYIQLHVFENHPVYTVRPIVGITCMSLHLQKSQLQLPVHEDNTKSNFVCKSYCTLFNVCVSHQNHQRLSSQLLVYTPTGTRFHACGEHIHSLASEEVSLNAMPPEPLLESTKDPVFTGATWHTIHLFFKLFKK